MLGNEQLPEPDDIISRMAEGVQVPKFPIDSLPASLTSDYFPSLEITNHIGQSGKVGLLDALRIQDGYDIPTSTIDFHNMNPLPNHKILAVVKGAAALKKTEEEWAWSMDEMPLVVLHDSGRIHTRTSREVFRVINMLFGRALATAFPHLKADELTARLRRVHSRALNANEVLQQDHEATRGATWGGGRASEQPPLVQLPLEQPPLDPQQPPLAPGAAAPGPRDAAPGPHGADPAAACDAAPGPGAAASLCCPLPPVAARACAARCCSPPPPSSSPCGACSRGTEGMGVAGVGVMGGVFPFPSSSFRSHCCSCRWGEGVRVWGSQGSGTGVAGVRPTSRPS
ncbi:unnamed protein product [Closterium sp. NIES-53]